MEEKEKYQYKEKVKEDFPSVSRDLVSLETKAKEVKASSETKIKSLQSEKKMWFLIQIVLPILVITAVYFFKIVLNYNILELLDLMSLLADYTTTLFLASIFTLINVVADSFKAKDVDDKSDFALNMINLVLLIIVYTFFKILNVTSFYQNSVLFISFHLILTILITIYTYLRVDGQKEKLLINRFKIVKK